MNLPECAEILPEPKRIDYNMPLQKIANDLYRAPSRQRISRASSHNAPRTIKALERMDDADDAAG